MRKSGLRNRIRKSRRHCEKSTGRRPLSGRQWPRECYDLRKNKFMITRISPHLLCGVLLLLELRGEAALSAPAPQPSQRADPLIAKIVSDISEERIAGILRKLESFE